MDTHFASPERSSQAELKKEHDLIIHHPHIKHVINSLPNITLLTNLNRQIVYSNTVLKELKGLGNSEDILGLRPGEVFGCIHANQEPGGCGTSRFCRYCGAVGTILKTIKSGKTENGEFHMTYNAGAGQKAIDFSISVTPMKISSIDLLMTTLIDISSQKRWQMLEKIFFHDLMNKMGSLHGFLELINTRKKETLPETIAPMMMTLGTEILDEIKAQHNIIQAENNELTITPQSISIPDLIDGCIKQMLQHPVADNKQIEFVNTDGDFKAETDPVLLKRIIINLIKNALEAIPAEKAVHVKCKKHMNTVEIMVANPGVMPEEVQLQLFVRSFSTKGHNRGLGTYSVKLLTEEYLKGNVVFESNEKSGTVFRIFIKLSYPKTGSLQ